MVYSGGEAEHELRERSLQRNLRFRSGVIGQIGGLAHLGVRWPNVKSEIDFFHSQK